MDKKMGKVKVPCKCRLCLREIISSGTRIWGDSGIHDMVLRCSGVNVLETDEFQFVCLRCKRHLDCANKFRQMCLKSNEIFLKTTFIKKEDSFSDSSPQHEIKIERWNEEEIMIEWNEDDYKFFHSHGDEDAIETATKLDSEGAKLVTKKAEKTNVVKKKKITNDEKEVEYPCEECPMISYKEDDHLIHLKSHKVQNKMCTRIHLCPICGKILKKNCDFLTHVELHALPPKSKKCDECGKMLSNNGTLKQHKLCHRPKVLLDCALCGCKVTKKGRQRHMESVHNQQQTSCPFCGRKFNCRFNMRVHLRTHTGELPYSCPDCGISFSHRVTMKLHRLKEHKINMFDPPKAKLGLKRKGRKANKKDNSASEFEG